MAMQRLSQAEFDARAAGAVRLSTDRHGDKVLLAPDGRIIKLFRRKRLLSSTWLFPYAQRFARASRELRARGFAAPPIELVSRVPSMRRDIVVYPMMPGLALRDALTRGESNATRERLLPPLARLFAALHARGVYFRAAHFGNFLVHDAADGSAAFALIDLSEARFRRGPLSTAMRARNFRPLTRYAEDAAAVRAFGVERFIATYLDAAELPAAVKPRFLSGLRRVDPLFAAV